MISYISEIKLKQSLRKVALISIISLMVLCLFTFATFKVVSYFYTYTNSTALENMVMEYAINLKKKSQSDLRALRTLALFTKNGSDLAKTYSGVQSEHVPFDIVGYWYMDGSCEQISLTGVPFDHHYRDLPPQVKMAISSAWLGHATVSAPYYSPSIGKDMITYVAPVFSSEGQILGALSGAVTQSSFDDMLKQLSMANHGVDTFLANSSGIIFSEGINNIIPSKLREITSFSGFDNASIDRIKMGLVSVTATTFTTKINGNSFDVTLTPLGFSDWYIGTISPNDIRSSPYFNALLLLSISIFIIFTVCVFIAIYLFLSMKSSYKTQLLIAHYDPLTNSFNFPKFLLEFDLLDYRTKLEAAYAVVSLNIHDFSYTKEMLGEQMSDEILCIIARNIRSQEHVIMFCHHVGDQFFFIVDLKKQDEVEDLVYDLMKRCVTDINNEVSVIPIVMYAGVAFTYPDLTPDKIVARAEFAKKQVAKSYTHAVRFYDENAYKKEAFLHSIEKTMRQALVDQEFKLFLQPKIDLATGKIKAAEALVRWISADAVIVYPNDFIPLFEKNGFCTELDLYMFDKVCQKIRYYLDNNIEPIYFSINQTKLLFFQKGYTQRLKEMLERYNIPPRYIVIEVLEDLATSNVAELNHHIQELKNLGLSIALDDFGSGYSSLNIVAGLDIDEIKFDREFLLADDPMQIKRNQMILRVLSKLAHEMGIRTVVEGVERHEDVEFLRTIDCDLAQGYYYDRPLAAEAFDRKYMFHQNETPIPATKAEQSAATTTTTAMATAVPTAPTPGTPAPAVSATPTPGTPATAMAPIAPAPVNAATAAPSAPANAAPAPAAPAPGASADPATSSHDNPAS